MSMDAGGHTVAHGGVGLCDDERMTLPPAKLFVRLPIHRIRDDLHAAVLGLSRELFLGAVSAAERHRDELADYVHAVDAKGNEPCREL
jgi:hypothetical protein